jgi:DNA mismatch repair protein MutL
MRIKQLPALIANQIAAGEVIERPASVVKELLENARDANATNVTIELSYAGLNQIKISDDGCGIWADDLLLAISAHATSKISNLDDLYNITTMGFRGEALASIASISNMTIISKPKSQKHAEMLKVKDNIINSEPTARNMGTTILVEDLFYNAPVRRKFLKSEKSELLIIEDVIKRFALSSPNIGINLIHNNKKILSLPIATNFDCIKARVKKIFGAKFIAESFFIDAKYQNTSLRGWISSPYYQRSQKDRLWIYVNNRMVKDKLLNHAILQAYQDIIYPGRFPSCLLYLDLNASEVDVNVHPTKHEVRFQNQRIVHDFIVSSVISKLSNNQITCQTVSDVIITHQKPWNNDDITKFDCEIKPNIDTQNTLLEAEKSNHQLNQDPLHIKTIKPEMDLAFDTIRNNGQILNDSFAIYFLKNREPYLINLAKLNKHYIQNTLKTQSMPLSSRPLLVPISFEIKPKDIILFESIKLRLLGFGIEYDFISANSIAIRTIPQCLPMLDIDLLFNNLITKNLDTSQLFEVIIASTSFDALQVSLDEQQELLDYMMQKKLLLDYSVHLTHAACMGIFKNG